MSNVETRPLYASSLTPYTDWKTFEDPNSDGWIKTGAAIVGVNKTVGILAGGVAAVRGFGYTRPPSGFVKPPPLPPPVVAESTAVSLRAQLQGVVDLAVEKIAVNPGLAKNLMSEGSYRHLVDGTRLAPASYGKAIERLAARIIGKDGTLSSKFRHQSRPFESTPDFFGYDGLNVQLFDITTPAGIRRHLARPYGPYTEFVTHPGLPEKLAFPK